MPQSPGDPGLTRLAYSPEQAATQLGVSRAFVYNLLRDGSIRSVKLGSRRLIPHGALVALLEGEPEAEAQPA